MLHKAFGFAVWAVLVTTIVPVARGEVTPDGVRDSIAAAAAYLKNQQNKADGGWGDPVAQAGGLTSLVTLALLSAGESPQSEPIQKSLKLLESIGNPKMTYATSLQTMVYCAVDPRRYRVRIGENVRWLENIQVPGGDGAGSWGYSETRARGDNSNSQFALLALYEAERTGTRVNPDVWRRALEYWKRCQYPDGAWGYVPGDSPTGSMTCAGIASLVIASGQMSSGGARVAAGQVQCCGAEATDDTAERIERALQWLGRHFRIDGNPVAAGGLGTQSNSTYYFYYLYGIERVGRMTGRRYFVGDRLIDGRRVSQPHDWYREIAEHLVAEQDRSWKGDGLSEGNPVVATSMALLFLSKGRRPIVVSQLRLESDDWNTHGGGVPNLTRRLESRWKRDLTWQTIDARAATVEDLLQTPVLFLSGRDELQLAPDQKESLKQYVSQGGFLFVEACDGNGCDGQAFDRSFRKLMAELFPDSSLRLLPPDHPVWFAEQRVDPNHLRPLYGLDTCCRTSVVYCPKSLSCFWELVPFERNVEYPADVSAEIESVARIGENVITYATNRELKDKLDRPQLAAAGNDREIRRGTLYIPKLSHAGGADEATNALPNMLTLFARQTTLPVDTITRMLGPADERLYDFPLAFMHGRRAFRFSAAERKALTAYIERGGFLFADSICASPQFTESFRAEIRAMFPDAKWTRVPLDHPLLTPAYRGFDITSVALRDPQARAADDPLVARQVKTAPLLEGLEIDGRYAVIFSPYDISCALERGASLDCKGYLTADAGKIAVNILLYALQR